MTDWNERLRQVQRERAQYEEDLRLGRTPEQIRAKQLHDEQTQRDQRATDERRARRQWSERAIRDARIEALLRRYQSDVWRGQGRIVRVGTEKPEFESDGFRLFFPFAALVKGWSGGQGGYETSEQARGVTVTEVVADGISEAIAITDGEFRELSYGKQTGGMDKSQRERWEQYFKGAPLWIMPGREEAKSMRTTRGVEATAAAVEGALLEIGVARIRAGRVPGEIRK